MEMKERKRKAVGRGQTGVGKAGVSAGASVGATAMELPPVGRID